MESEERHCQAEPARDSLSEPKKAGKAKKRR